MRFIAALARKFSSILATAPAVWVEDLRWEWFPARPLSDMECCIGLAGFNDFKEGDLIEAFSTEKLAADLGALTTAKAQRAFVAGTNRPAS